MTAPSFIEMAPGDAADIPTLPATGNKRLLVDVGTGEFAQEDDAGVVTSLTGATGATGPGYGGTSTTSLAIGTGSKAFTTQAGLAYVAGSRVRAASAADPDTDWMEGVVSSYSGTTLTILMDLTSGSGTHTDWAFTLTGEPPARWLGAWDSGTAYGEGDAVSNDGSSYVCILAHTNEEPPNGTYWDVLAAGAGLDLDAIITASSGQDIADALAGAAAPDASNVFATMADVGGGGGGGTNFAQIFVAAGNGASSGGGWTINTYTDIGYADPGYQSSGAQNDAIAFDIFMEAGTYIVFCSFRKSSNTGIITVNLDAASQGTIDTYAAGPAYGTGTVTGISVTAGKRTWQLKMATKNASSSSYFGELFYLVIARTA